jgi:hypothetical protein
MAEAKIDYQTMSIPDALKALNVDMPPVIFKLANVCGDDLVQAQKGCQRLCGKGLSSIGCGAYRRRWQLGDARDSSDVRPTAHRLERNHRTRSQIWCYREDGYGR